MKFLTILLIPFLMLMGACGSQQEEEIEVPTQEEVEQAAQDAADAAEEAYEDAADAAEDAADELEDMVDDH
ncbi:MAG: hypothetical protein JJU29_04975 [Verrucomicrobia bacterium]|nr:hypothetical protein [Verrucomicrobiota bacterium]MCH8511293.1 hypothetical protein [Kiritimatiellia bacterium]